MENKQINITEKAVLTFKEAVEYTGFTPRYLYKLTGEKKIPFSKPNGKAIFFDRKELEDWLMGRNQEPKK